MTLSDERCVAYLIKYRSKIYPKDKAMRHFSDIMVLIYLTLDELIEKTELTLWQKKTIRYMMDGYTPLDLSEMWDVSRQVVDKHLRIAAYKIAKKSSAEAFALLERKYHNCLVG